VQLRVSVATGSTSHVEQQTKLADAQVALDEALKKLEEQRLKSANDEP